MFRGRVRLIHFIGIGGIGMSGLAEILRTMDFDVSGSDMRESEVTERLEGFDVKISVGHRASNIEQADVVVYTSAIKKDNPELQEAIRRGIPCITRGEMLAELMRLKYGVAIAGSHGKTTTTSLVATVLRAAGLDPTVVVGGRMAALGSNAKLGAGDLLVAEADESDGSFLRLNPTISVVTNIDPEHLDHYGDFETLKAAFVNFLNKVPFYGLAVLCLDHPVVQELIPQLSRRFVTYGLSPQADYHARGLEYQGLHTFFDVFHGKKSLGRFSVRMPGEHNVLNTLATIALADELEVPLDVIKDALATFHGVARRFTVVGRPGGVTLVDDYGHHPAEIVATLKAARRAISGRVHVIFQPHRYSRTEILFEDFSKAFNDADDLTMIDIYPAGEQPIPGISASTLCDKIAAHGHHNVRYASSREEAVTSLASRVEAGDAVLALGAGDVNRLLQPLDLALRQRFGEE